MATRDRSPGIANSFLNLAGMVFDRTTNALTLALGTLTKLTLTKEVLSPVTRTAASGNITLVAGTDTTYQFIDGNGSNRDVTLPTAATGLTYFIMNISDTEVLTVKDAGASTLATLAAGEFNTFIYDGTAWEVI